MNNHFQHIYISFRYISDKQAKSIGRGRFAQTLFLNFSLLQVILIFRRCPRTTIRRVSLGRRINEKPWLEKSEANSTFKSLFAHTYVHASEISHRGQCRPSIHQ